MNICFCGNTDLVEFSEDYYLCNKCHTLISKREFGNGTYEVLSEERDLYGSNYWKKHMLELSGEKSLDAIVDRYYRDRVPYWIHYILKYTDNSYKAAEIGCGLGQLASAMRTIGYEQEAFELSPEICDFMRSKMGVNVTCGDFTKSKDKYDLVIAYDLIEHLDKPVEFVDSIRSHMTERGILCIQTPCYDPVFLYEDYSKDEARVLDHLKPDEHIYIYSRESIKLLLEKTGFDNVIFEPAVFGDDYDCFLFASVRPFAGVDEDIITNRYRNSVAGRMLKASYDLMMESKYFQKEAEERLKVIKVLDEAVHGK